MSLGHIPPIIVRKNPPTFEPGKWLFEPKYDGWRAMLYIEPEQYYFLSRHGRTLHQFANLAARIADELKIRTAIFDGEITTLDPTTGYSAGRPNTRGVNVYYLAFDLLQLKSDSLRQLPLAKRKAALTRVAARRNHIRLVGHVPDLTSEFLERVQTLNLEGIVAKKKCDPYSRATNWYKVLNSGYRPARHKPER